MGIAESEVRNPTEMLALGDAFASRPNQILGGKGYGIQAWYETIERQRSSCQTVSGATLFWVPNTNFNENIHDRRANVVFCDGHVEGQSFKSLFLDADDPSSRRWNRDNEPLRGIAE